MKKAFFLCLAVFCLHIHAANYYWTGATSSDWSLASNWLVGATVPSVAPSATDRVFIQGSISNAPELTASVTMATLLMDAGKTLDMNGFNLTVDGINSNTDMVNLTNVTLRNLNSAVLSTLTFKNIKGNINAIRIIDSQLGQTASDNMTLNIGGGATGNSADNVVLQGSVFNVPCMVESPNLTSSGNTFNKNFTYIKRAGSGSAAVTTIGANTYFANVSFTAPNAAGKSIMVGDANTVSNFHGAIFSIANLNNASELLSVRNVMFHNPCTISAGGYDMNASNLDFRTHVNFSGGTRKLTINASFFQDLTLSTSGLSGLVVLNDMPITSNILVSTTGQSAGTLLFNTCLIQTPLQVGGEGAGAVTFAGCTFNDNITVSKTGGTGTVLISSPSFDTGKTLSLGTFSSGILKLSNGWTTLTNDLSLSLTGTAALVLENIQLSRDLTVTSPQMQIAGSANTFQGALDLSVLNNTSTYRNWGAATFSGPFKLRQEAGLIMLAATGNMVFENVFDSYGPSTGSASNLILGSNNYSCNFHKDVKIDYINKGSCGCNYNYKVFNVKFLGSNPQVLSSGTGTTTQLDIYKFEINKPASDLVVDKSSFLIFDMNFQTHGELKLTSGRIINNMPGSKPVIFNRTSYTGSGTSSYIVGKVAKARTGTIFTPESFTFPVGSLAHYAPIVMTRNDQSTGLTGVEYFEATPPNIESFGTAKDVSSCEYWKFNNYNAQGIVQSILSYDVEVTPSLIYRDVNNCTPFYLPIMGIAYNNAGLWNEVPSTLSSGSSNQLAAIEGNASYKSAVVHNMYITFSYKSAVRLDVSAVKPNSASLTSNFDQIPQFYGGQTNLVKVHPNFNTTADLTIQGDAGSEGMFLKIPVNTFGNPTSVNLVDGTALNPQFYTISGSTIKFHDEAEESLTFEDFTMNSGSDGITLSNSNSLVITPPLNLSITRYKMNGATTYTTLGTAATNASPLSINISSLANYPAGSRNSIVFTVSDGTETFDVQGYFIKP